MSARRTAPSSTTGSEGVETVIKLVRRAWHAQGKTERNIILSRRQAYHGLGVASLSATGIEPLREGFDPLPEGFVHLSCARALHRPERDGRAGRRARADHRRHRSRPDRGVHRRAGYRRGRRHPAAGRYWARVQEVLGRHGILLIADEVITACGRTGHRFASERHGIEPDVINTAKALTSGYMPMGAVFIGPRSWR